MSPIPARNILQPLRTGVWPCARTSFSINPYRGCEIGCVYCYARFTHEFMGPGSWQNFEKRIHFKENAAEILRRDLARFRSGAPSQRPPAESGRESRPAEPSIAIGTVTDPYQPIEARLQVTRSILQVLAEPGSPKGLKIQLTTKSDLILRDVDLLLEIARKDVLAVNITITTLGYDLAKVLEPRAPGPKRRLEALSALRKAGIRSGVFLMPLIPGVNDSEEAIEALAREAKAAGALYLSESPLLLFPQAAEPFFRFLRREYPQLEKAYREAFEESARVSGAYEGKIRRRVSLARNRHGLLPSPDGESPPRRQVTRARAPSKPVLRQLEIPGI